MANQEVNLVFRLVGNGAQAVKQINNDIKTLGHSMVDFSQKASRMSQSIAFLGGGIVGAFSLSLKTASEYSIKTKTALDSMNNTLVRLQVQIAEAVLPVVQRFANLLSNLLTWFSNLDPAMKNIVLQTTLLAGAWALFGGAILKVVAIFSRMIGIIMMASPQMVALAGAIGIGIYALNRMGVTLTDVINAFEIFFRMVVIGMNRVIRVVAEGMEKILFVIEKVISGINFISDKMQGVFGKQGGEWQITKGLKDARLALDGFGQALDGRAEEIEAGMQRIFQTGGGTGTDIFQGLKDQIAGLTQGGGFVEPMVKQFNMMEDIARGTAQAMQQTFSNVLFKAFTNDLSNLKQTFADFGRSILQILSQAIAKMMLVKMLSAMGPWGKGLASFMHSGGTVKKAHSGYLASDEVPIVAQAGEGVISKRGMSKLGSAGLNRLNGGDGGGGGGGLTININPVIQAWDATDVYRNRSMITGVITESIRNNSEVRKIIKAYA